MADPLWNDLGPAEEWKKKPVSAAAVGRTALADRAIAFAELLRRNVAPMEKIERAGRKADGMGMSSGG